CNSMNRPRPILALVLLAGLALVPACVTESIKPTTGRSTGMRVTPGFNSAPANTTATTKGAKPTPTPVLPDGPIAAPATAGKTLTSEVQVGVIPMGVVLYDGQALPLVSPDGRFIVVQEGDPPTWEAILAEPAAAQPNGTTMAVYEVGPHELKRIPP